MKKSDLRIELARICSAIGAPLPNDYSSLTVAGLKERIAALSPQLETEDPGPSDSPELRGQVTEPCIPMPPESETSTKARNAQDFASRYAIFVQRLRQNRTDKQAAMAILAAPKFIARLTGCTVTTQGPRMFVHDHGKKIPLEDTNLQW